MDMQETYCLLFLASFEYNFGKKGDMRMQTHFITKIKLE